jgi:glycosyltransferase involved in cell wall biosynthesis
MKITFGMICFNAINNLPEGMLEMCILNVYDIAHEIIIVEGATKAITHRFDGDTSKYTTDGSSTDDTINVIKNIPDPLNKIKLIESNGFWDGKTEMCNAWASIATGDYIWQIDSDEFYHKSDMLKVKNILEKEKPDAIWFNAYHFFGGFDYCIDERGLLLTDDKSQWGCGPWYRLFKNVPGKSRWLSHEPPSYYCDGNICNDGLLLNQNYMSENGIKMYHYSYTNYEQIKWKSDFFQYPDYITYWNKFKEDKSFKPFGTTVFPFDGEHPEIIKNKYNL